MPRGKKKEPVVLYAPDGHIIKHVYHNNKSKVEKDKAFAKVYDPVSRKRVTPKVKKEKHS